MSENQKGTALMGEALTDETLASSDSILNAGSYGVGIKGLQQFYSPPELAALVGRIMGSRINVLDPTAGDGSLLASIDPPHSYGIEIDKDQIKNAEGSYHALKGDLQHFYGLLKMSVPNWVGIVANPPFGLTWSDPTHKGGKPTNSTVLTYIYCSRLLAEEGQLIFICGRDRFYRQVKDLPEAKGIYAVIEVEDLFEGTSLPCVIAFAIDEGNREPSSIGFDARPFTKDTLDLAHTWVIEKREAALGRYNSVRTSEYRGDIVDEFKAVQDEYNRRIEKRIKTREFDAQLKDKSHIQWLPSAFAQLSLATAGEKHSFTGLNGQPVTYFSQNERLWNKLLQLAERDILTVDPKLIAAVESVVGLIRRNRIPLYAVKTAQRLGFLTDIEFLRCIKDDEEKGFVAGEHYRLDTQTKTVIERSTRVVESKKNPGEYNMKEFEKQTKLMEVRLSGGRANFVMYDGGKDASDNMRYLIEHFNLPDPGDVGTRHPEEIERLEKIAQEVLDDFLLKSREWEKKNPTAMPYTHRGFQKKDIARLLFKKGGLLSWEQGLGKTLGGLLFYACAVKLGAKEQLLVVTGNDLIPQWTREFERFLGKTPMVIKTHGEAHRIAGSLKHGGKGLYITHYEALAVNGTRGKNLMLPVVTVKEWVEKELRKGTDRTNYFVWEYNDNADVEFTTDKAIELGRERLATLEAEWIAGEMTEEQEAAKPPFTLEQWDEACSTTWGKNQTYRWLPFLGIIQKPTGQSPESQGGTKATYGRIYAQYNDVTKVLTSKDICPECQSDKRQGWNGIFCEAEDKAGKKCGYVHMSIRMKPVASLLSTAFKKGVICLDEITMIQGNWAKRSIALRGLRCHWKLGMTGTPIKNFIPQAFWLLWWSLGNGSVRFPFEYEGGLTRFENDFAVIEWARDSGKKQNRKVLPEVTNLSMLWRLLASSIIRRRKEDTGEDLVPKYFHQIDVPLGIAQIEQTAAWLKKLPNGFPGFFAEKYPDAKVVKAGMHEILAPMLGLNWKLDYALTVPEADPDVEWTGVEGVSNWTPANLRVLELAMALVKQGRKVLIGSNLVATSKWIADRLNEKGVKAEHILDEDGTTTNAANRAKRVYSFQTDEVQVFCAGVNAIRLGHNLDAADAAIMHGLDWSFDTNDQFVSRIHRLTSKNPIDVFIIVPKLDGQDTLTSKKWATLGMKQGATELALDGRLLDHNEQEIDKSAIVRELQERGLRLTDEAVDEVSVFETWEGIPQIEQYVAQATLIPPRPGEPVPIMGPITEATHDAILAVAGFLTAGEFGIVPAVDPEAAQEAQTVAAVEEAVEEAVALQPTEEELALERELAEIEEKALVAIVTSSSDSSPDSTEAEVEVIESDGPFSNDAFVPFAGNTDLEADYSPQAEADSAEPTPEPATPTEEASSASERTSLDAEQQATAHDAEPADEGQGGSRHDEAGDTDGRPQQATAEHASAVPPLDVMDQIKKAKELHDLGILTDEEFASAKAKLIARLDG